VDINGIGECYERHRAALVRFAATQVGPHDAPDVVSDAVIGVLRAQRTNTHVTDPRSYLYRAVANAARKHWRSVDRRTRRERIAALPEAVDDTIADPDVLSAIARLSPQQRAVIHLAYWEDLTVSDIADRLGVGNGTVKRQLARARSRLAEVLDDSH
jgi:RNA polymerase sigma-70 factor (ECF subfamily)